jgi:hypothetical protein
VWAVCSHFTAQTILPRMKPVQEKRAVPLAAGIALAACLAAASCGGGSGELTPAQKEFLEAWAGELAPLAVLGEGPGGAAPDSSELESLIGFCDEDPVRWAYLFECIRDSIGSVPPPEPGCLEDSLSRSGSSAGTPSTGPATR